MRRDGTSATLAGLLRPVTHRDPGESPTTGQHPVEPCPAVVVVGVVGGAGTTTLVRSLGPPALDAGRVLPAPDGRPLLLVTRGTAAGTAAALQMLTAAHRLGHYLPSLAVVADGPWPPPPQARARLRLLRDPTRLRTVVPVPYVVGWRDVDDPLTGAPLPRAFHTALGQLSSALHAASPTPAPTTAPTGAAVRMTA